MENEQIIFEKICIYNERLELQYFTEENKIKQILKLLCIYQMINIDLVEKLLKKYYEIFPNSDITEENLNLLINNFKSSNSNLGNNQNILQNLLNNLVRNEENNESNEETVLDNNINQPINEEQAIVDQPINEEQAIVDQPINEEQAMNEIEEQEMNEIEEQAMNEIEEQEMNNIDEQELDNNQFNNIENLNIENIFNNLIQNTIVNPGVYSTVTINFNNVNSVNNSNNLNNNPEDIPLVITEESLNKLEPKVFNQLCTNIKLNNKSCPISLEAFKDDDKILILPCNHIFKYDDIKEWLINNSHKCPVCRTSAGEYKAKIE